MVDRSQRQGTLADWAGEIDRDSWQGATQVPVVNSVAIGYQGLGESQAVALKLVLAGTRSGAIRA